MISFYGRIRNNLKKALTLGVKYGNITNVARSSLMERYRSGHNGAVLKTVCQQWRKGSNPFLSAIFFLNLPRFGGLPKW